MTQRPQDRCRGGGEWDPRRHRVGRCQSSEGSGRPPSRDDHRRHPRAVTGTTAFETIGEKERCLRPRPDARRQTRSSPTWSDRGPFFTSSQGIGVWPVVRISSRVASAAHISEHASPVRSRTGDAAGVIGRPAPRPRTVGFGSGVRPLTLGPRILERSHGTSRGR